MKRWVPAVVLGGIVLIVWLCVYQPLGNEPKYDGKPVSYWFKEYCLSGQYGHWNPTRNTLASVSLKELGTNAVPYLVGQAFDFRKESAAWSNYCRFMQSLPDSWATPRPVIAEVRANEAAFALEDLHPPANVLLPLIKKQLENTNGIKHLQALFLAGTAGDGAEECVPYLITELSSTNIHTLHLTMQSLRWVGPKAEAAVPALIKIVEENRGADTNHVGRSAALALGKIRSPKAAPAIPAIKEYFEQEKTWTRQCEMAGILIQIDPKQTQALEFLEEGVTNHQPASDRQAAIYQLGEAGPAALPAVPALLQALEGTNEILFDTIPRTLEKIGIAKEVFLPTIKNQLNFTSNAPANIVANTAARVLEWDPTDHEAHLALMKLIQNNSPLDQFSIETLARMGPAAAEGLPVLQMAVTNGLSSSVREAARDAIKQIERAPKQK